MNERKVTVELTLSELMAARLACFQVVSFLIDCDMPEDNSTFESTQSAWVKLKEAYDESFVRLYEKDEIQAAEESGKDEN